MFVTGIIFLAVGAVFFIAAGAAAGNATSYDAISAGVVLYVFGFIFEAVGTPLFIVGLIKKIKRGKANNAPAQPQYQQPQYQAPQQPQYQAPAQPAQPQQGGFCPNCGAALEPGAAFCPNCGAAVNK